MKALRWIVPIAIVAAAVALRVLAPKPEAAAALPPLPVRVTRPERGDLTESLRLNAHVESESMVTVLPLVSGVIQDLFVDAGSRVKKDQIIARIDAARFELQLKQAESAYFSSKSTYERVAQLYRAAATSQQNYDQAKAQYEAYASQYELARLQLGYASVKSPVDGIVLMKHLSVGALAAPERPLVTVGDLGQLVLRVRVPERHYAAFLAGIGIMPIAVEDASGRRYAGRLRTVSPFVSAESKSFEALVAIEGDTETLRPGMFVGVEFELARWAGVLSLPYEALSGDGRVWFVEGDAARSEAYRPSAGSATRFVVPEAWAGRELIVEGYYFLKDGSPVTIVGPAPSAAPSPRAP